MAIMILPFDKTLLPLYRAHSSNNIIIITPVLSLVLEMLADKPTGNTPNRSQAWITPPELMGVSSQRP
jgi:hypothetical protein